MPRHGASFETVKRGRPQRCKRVTFKRARKGGKVLPQSRWITVVRCKGEKLETAARRRYRKFKPCRRGGKGSKKHLFVRCAARRRA